MMIIYLLNENSIYYTSFTQVPIFMEGKLEGDLKSEIKKLYE